MYLVHGHVLSMVIESNRNLTCKPKFSVHKRKTSSDIKKSILKSFQDESLTDLKKIGWSVNGEAEASASFPSSPVNAVKPLWLVCLCAGTEIIGAASWLLLMLLCLEKLQEISGVAVLFVVTQAAGKQSSNESCNPNNVFNNYE